MIQGSDMFRPLTRTNQELPRDRCIDILCNTKRGVLSVIGDDGYPYGMPLNHYYDPKDGRIYFHGGKQGHKVDALKRNNKVSYCVYTDGIREEGNWYLTFESVIVFGKVIFIEDEDIIREKSRELSYQFTADEEYINYEIERSLNGTLMFAIEIENITGKTVKEK